MLAIIGGTGLYQLAGLAISETLSIETPFGKPSAPIVKGIFGDKTVLFLPRHGPSHQYLPHEINYRANIFALKEAGARQVISISATGSLRGNIHPGQLVVPNQYFDFTRGSRPSTFFGNGIVAHIAAAQPVCQHLTRWITEGANTLDVSLINNKVYACINGPRLGTQAESHFLRLAGCDLVGMTNIPEVFLAREAQLCYATIAIVTDYDCWKDDPDQQVSVSQVISRYRESLSTVQTLLETLLALPLPLIDPLYRESLKDALLTPEHAIPSEKRLWLSVLKQ